MSQARIARREAKQERIKELTKEGLSSIKRKTLDSKKKTYLLGVTRKMIRQLVKDQLSTIGKIGSSDFAILPSRKERKLAAKENKTPFIAHYNGEIIRVQHKDVLKIQKNEIKRKEKLKAQKKSKKKSA